METPRTEPTNARRPWYRRWGCIIPLGFGLIILVCVGGPAVIYATRGVGPAPTPTSAPARITATATRTPQPTTVAITYMIQSAPGTQVVITYSNATGGIEQLTDAQLPASGHWEKQMRVASNTPVTLSAQVRPTSYQMPVDITCAIYLNGHQWKQATSSGTAAVVSCSGLATVD